ncbi:site-2 protease family protein [Streptomyces sp. V4I2]|uniref:site-2 protease family protein n=1 Tax=Streptomyces sp. V4I2 TaxID=3042280 RepID=UPI002786E211|nr:site-2 protease family protein [Streptomyces sp. V4I2]MDQ1044083.1 Zn-dependent protease [Streptomyces sp. V4I2]
MDESGGSGQPRPGNDESAEHHAAPATPAPDPAHPDEATPTDEPTMVVRQLDLPADDSTGDDATGDAGTVREGTAREGNEPAEHGTEAKGSEGKGTESKGTETHGSETHGSETHGSAEQGQNPQASPDHDHQPTPASPPAPASTPPAPVSPPAPDDHPHTDTSAGDRTLARSGLAKGRPPKRPREPGPGGGLLMGRPFGVPVYVAPSWFLVAALITWVFGGQLDRVLPELGAARYLVSLFFAVAFYASVLVHELAHTVAALRFKLPVRRIQLQFFGGVSEIEKEAETPGREFWLAFVGPLLSLVLSGLFYLALQPVEPGTVPGVLLAGLMISNLIVAAFNLLPGLPLDGGRMLRAVVWKITGRPMTGTIAAAWVGRALAVSVLIGLPLLTQSGALGSNAEDNVGMDTVMDALLAAILAAIIWTGAGNSLRMARLREHLPELRARNLTRRAVPVETDTPLSEALRRANAAGARALVVVDADGQPLSLVREAAIVGVPEHRRPWVAVSGLAQDLTDGMRVSAELAGEDLLDALRAAPATEYLVVEETGEIYGVLSAADVERAFVKAMARPS